MATTRPCESEVYIMVNGAPVLYINLTEFTITAAAENESIPVLGNNCVDKGATSSKELTGSMNYCWDCENDAHLQMDCAGRYEFMYYPKGMNYVSPNGNAVPLFHGFMQLSGGDFGSTASESAIQVPVNFSISEVVSSNLFIR